MYYWYSNFRRTHVDVCKNYYLAFSNVNPQNGISQLYQTFFSFLFATKSSVNHSRQRLNKSFCLLNAIGQQLVFKYKNDSTKMQKVHNSSSNIWRDFGCHGFFTKATKIGESLSLVPLGCCCLFILIGIPQINCRLLF